MNVVIIAKTHLRTQARAHVVLFSSDLELAYAPLVDSYSLRFHIEYCFRTLQHMLAAGACQVHSEDTYYGHLVLRLMGCLVLFYTSRVICKGRMTMEGLLESAGWRLG